MVQYVLVYDSLHGKNVACCSSILCLANECILWTRRSACTKARHQTDRDIFAYLMSGSFPKVQCMLAYQKLGCNPVVMSVADPMTVIDCGLWSLDLAQCALAYKKLGIPSKMCSCLFNVLGFRMAQCTLAYKKLGINPIVMSAGELESGNAGEPAKLVRQRYREASDIIRKGKLCSLFINDLDAGAPLTPVALLFSVSHKSKSISMPRMSSGRASSARCSSTISMQEPCTLF